MRVQEIRELNAQDIEKELENSYKELLNLRFRRSTKQLTNTVELKNIRRKIARVKTIIREKQLGAD